MDCKGLITLGANTPKEDFLSNAVGLTNKFLKEGLTFEVKNLMVSGSHIVAEMNSKSTQKNWMPYDNSYCWVLRFENNKIKEARTYLDTAILQSALDANLSTADERDV